MNKLLIILLLAAVFIFGCTTSQTNNANQTNNTKDYNTNTTENISENIIEENNKISEIKTCENEQITNNTYKKTNLDIWGNKIVWEEQRGYSYYLLVYDIATNKLREIPRFSYETSIASLSIFDNEIITLEGWDIEMYNLKSNDTKEISLRYTKYVSYPDISENILSYTGGANSNTVYCTNLSDEDKCTHVIEDIFSIVKGVKTYNNILTWISKEYGSYNIKYYNISNRQKEEKIKCIEMYGYVNCYISCHYAENKSDIKTIHTGKDIDNIAFYKNLIVWQEKNSDWDIVYYDLSSNKTTKVVKNSADQINPSTSLRYVVWQDYRNGNWDIYAYDLINKKEIQITNSPQNETNPVVFWKRIAWLQDNNIYTCVVK